MRFLEENIGWYNQCLKEKKGLWHVTVKQCGNTIFDLDVKKIENNSRDLRVTTLDNKEFIFVKPLCETTASF